MPRCFILNRVSTEKQKDNLSITVQRKIHPIIADQLDCTYTKEDIFDLDVSSTTYDREKWQSVKKAIASGRYANGYGIFGSIDRYHRDKDEWFEFLTHCLRQKITVVIPDTYTFDLKREIPIQMYNPDKFKDLIQLVFEIEEAENFKKKFRKKVLLAFSHARDAGINIFGTGTTTLGYRWTMEKPVMIGGHAYGRFEIVPEEARVVKHIFTKNLKAPNMARWLNEHGYRLRHGGPWDSTQVYRVREKFIYAGKMKNSNGDLINAVNVEPLIDFKQWLAAQRLTEKTISVKRPINVKFILSGYTYCGLCHDEGIENRMVRQTYDRTRLDTTSLLYCHWKKFKASGRICQQRGRGFKMLNMLRVINADLADKLSDKKFLEKAIGEYRKRLERRSDAATLKQLNVSLKSVEKKIQNLAVAVAEGFDRSVAIDQLNELKENRLLLQQRIATTMQPQKTLEKIPYVEECQALAQKFLSVKTTLSNELLIKLHLLFIEKINLYPDSIKIYYRYFKETKLPLPDAVLTSRKIDLTGLVNDLGKIRMKDLQTKYNATGNGIRYQLKKLGLKNGRYKVKK